MMITGTVIRFNKIKGYGFIQSNECDTEIFVHFSEVISEGYKELKEGQQVRFTMEAGEKGPFAKNVTVIE